jgi:hypothetical protein
MTNLQKQMDALQQQVTQQPTPPQPAPGTPPQPAPGTPPQPETQRSNQPG